MFYYYSTILYFQAKSCTTKSKINLFVQDNDEKKLVTLMRSPAHLHVSNRFYNDYLQGTVKGTQISFMFAAKHTVLIWFIIYSFFHIFRTLLLKGGKVVQ